MKNDITKPLPKGSLTNERKSRQRAGFVHTIKVALNAIAFTVYGLAVITVVTGFGMQLAGNPVNPTGALYKWSVFSEIMTVLPIAWHIGRGVIRVLKELAEREVK